MDLATASLSVIYSSSDVPPNSILRSILLTNTEAKPRGKMVFGSEGRQKIKLPETKLQLNPTTFSFKLVILCLIVWTEYKFRSFGPLVARQSAKHQETSQK